MCAQAMPNMCEPVCSKSGCAVLNLSSAVVNLTRRVRRRSSIEVGLAYDTDLPAAVPVMIEAAKAVPGVYADPPP